MYFNPPFFIWIPAKILSLKGIKCPNVIVTVYKSVEFSIQTAKFV